MDLLVHENEEKNTQECVCITPIINAIKRACSIFFVMNLQPKKRKDA
jgi:hypothetical protein